MSSTMHPAAPVPPHAPTDPQHEADTTRYTSDGSRLRTVVTSASREAGLFLVIWWARHWRRTRRSRALMPPDEPSGADADVGSGPGASGGGEAAPPSPADDAHYRPAHMAGHRSRS